MKQRFLFAKHYQIRLSWQIVVGAVLEEESGRFKFYGAANLKVETLSTPSSISNSPTSRKFSWNFFSSVVSLYSCFFHQRLFTFYFEILTREN